MRNLTLPSAKGVYNYNIKHDNYEFGVGINVTTKLSALGNITRYGFHVNSGQLFWCITLEAMCVCLFVCLFVFVCLFLWGLSSHSGFFTHMETSPGRQNLTDARLSWPLSS